MNSLSKNAFSDYIRSKGIVQVEQGKEYKLKKLITDKDAVEQLYLISEFHRRTMGYDNYLCHRLEDKRGRTVEEYKIYSRRIKRQYEYIKKKNLRSDFENLIVQKGEHYIKRGEKAIDEVNNNGYLKLIKRSMDRCEICLGDTYFNNISKGENIEVVNLKGCAYNLVEIDGLYFLNKLMKKGIKLDYEKLIENFCEFEQLGEESVRFIYALLYYPYEFMKCFSKYMKYSGGIYKDKYKSKLEKLLIHGSQNLL